MAIQIGKALAFTAVGGMVAGLAGCGTPAAAGGEPATSPEEAAAAATAGANDCCQGKNECKATGGCKAADCK